MHMSMTYRNGGYRKHAEALRVRLERARQDVGTLRLMGVAPWIEPRAGMFL